MTSTPTATPVEFFFDPGCPFTWRTSRWLTAVEEAGAATVTEAVAEAGLPESVAAAVEDESLDAVVRAEHEASQAAVGDTAGSPVTALRGRGFFGPVVVPVPTGDAGLELFEAIPTLAAVPGFSEIKTARNPL